MVEGETGGARDGIPFDYAALPDRFDGAWMVNNGYDCRMAIDAVASRRADLVALGHPFVANSDLVARLAEDAPLNATMDPSTFYGVAHGYTDCLTLERALLDVA